MSGIIGLFRRDGAPVGSEMTAGMLGAIMHRGPDNSGVWNKGSAGLGHCMLWTTPESLSEILPFEDTASGLAITCDARIDNRAELIEGLGLQARVGEVTDSALILAAYVKWGVECPSHLIGDFVFAIFDNKNQQMFCARDPMGVKCLYYYLSDRLFAFSSEIKGLTRLSEVPQHLNEVRVLDYLVNLFDDRTITFYQHILRLPQATSLVVSRDQTRASTYWSLDPHRELKLASDEEYSEAFKTCFVESVRCRLRSAYPVVSALSGGLDSSSITCVARQLYDSAGNHQPLDTVSLIFPGLPKEDLRYIDEREFIDAVLTTGNYRPHFVHADQLTPLQDVRQIQFHLDEAFFAGNLYLHWEMYRTTHCNGSRIFLDGLDGDTTISHGFEYLADLILSLRWKTLLREVQLIRQNLGIGRKRVLRDYCIKPLCPTWVYKTWDWAHGRRGDTRITGELVTREFKERLGLTERVNSFLTSSRSCTRTAREKHWEMLNFPLYAHALEMADKASAAFQVEARYPFFDRRLIELCLALPARQKLGQGWSRWILRRAMEGILPKDIQWRPAKGNLSPNFYRKLIEGDRKLLDETVESQTLAPYLDLSAIKAAYRRYESAPLHSHVDSSQLFAAANLAVWLDTVRLKA
ncbi:MAG: asnB [Bryobacterales bacterium]|nr:asnB [Bryobacterales bacterium]